MASENLGPQMMAALVAVKQIHSDSSRLLRDLDAFLDGYKSVYGSFATTDLSYDIKKGLYMADGLLRHYVSAKFPNEVIAVNIVFFDINAEVKEPLFLVAKIKYASPLGAAPDKAKSWDPWAAYLVWNSEKVFEQVLSPQLPPKRADISSLIVAAVPLASLNSEVAVQHIVNLVQSSAYRVEQQVGQVLA